MAEVTGMSAKVGLYCRAMTTVGPCEVPFRGPIPEAAAARDAHEMALHGYHHKVPPTPGSRYAVVRRSNRA